MNLNRSFSARRALVLAIALTGTILASAALAFAASPALQIQGPTNTPIGSPIMFTVFGQFTHPGRAGSRANLVIVDEVHAATPKCRRRPHGQQVLKLGPAQSAGKFSQQLKLSLAHRGNYRLCGYLLNAKTRHVFRRASAFFHVH